MKNPFANWTKKEWLIWGVSLVIVVFCSLITYPIDLMTLFATVIGINMLMFTAKGNVIGLFLSLAFCIIYAIISYRFRYYGEMITYLGMSLPVALASIISWLKNPTEKDSKIVKIRHFNRKEAFVTCALSFVVTLCMYFVLKAFNTPNLIVSTISVSTSFAAAYLTFRRISFYALAYALNDLVLVTLWVMASFVDIGYIPIAINFLVFFFNDLYGYVSWRKRENA